MALPIFRLFEDIASICAQSSGGTKPPNACSKKPATASTSCSQNGLPTIWTNTVDSYAAQSFSRGNAFTAAPLSCSARQSS